MERLSTIGLLASGTLIISGLYFMAMADNEKTDEAENKKMKNGLKLLGVGAVLGVISGITLHKSLKKAS